MEDEFQDPAHHAGRFACAGAGNNVEALSRACPNDVPLPRIKGIAAVGLVNRSELVQPRHDSSGFDKAIIQLPVIIMVLIHAGSIACGFMGERGGETGVPEGLFEQKGERGIERG